MPDTAEEFMFPVRSSARHDTGPVCQEGLTCSAVLGIRVDAQIRMAVVCRVWGQVLVPVLPDAEPGDYQSLS